MNESMPPIRGKYFVLVAAIWPICVIVGCYFGDLDGVFFDRHTWIGYYSVPRSPGFFLVLLTLTGHLYGLFMVWFESNRGGILVSTTCSLIAGLLAWSVFAARYYAG